MSKKALKEIVKQFPKLTILELNSLSVYTLMAISKRHVQMAALANKEDSNGQN